MKDTRLSPLQKQALRYATQDIPSEYYLFGSMTESNRRGGDIDLLVINTTTRSNMDINLELTNKYTKICDEKIDIVVLGTQKTIAQEDFFTHIRKIPLGKIL